MVLFAKIIFFLCQNGHRKIQFKIEIVLVLISEGISVAKSSNVVDNKIIVCKMYQTLFWCF